MTALATIESAGVEIDHQAILKSLNLDVRQPATQALLLLCDRYGLDPLLKHVVLISGSVYVTRDGYLAIAHRSGVFDGMEVLEQGSDTTHFTARVAVYRKDMGRPFTFIGRYPKAQRMAKEYGPEMAVKVAEVQALRRAFNVTGVPAADERWDEQAQAERVEAKELPVYEPTRHLYEGTPPPRVDAATGEVAPPASRKRKPPTAAVEPVEVAEVVERAHPMDGGPLDGKPRREMATPLQVAVVTDLINAIKNAGGDWHAKALAAWKEAKLPSVGASGLHADEAELAETVLTAIYDEAAAAAQPTLDAS